MKTVKKAVLFLCIGILFYGCLNGTKYITLTNKSNKKITCQDVWSGSITSADTLFQCNLAPVGIDADSSYMFRSLSLDGGWEVDFKRIPYFQLLILDHSTYQKYRLNPCDTIRKYVPILHRYQVTLEDMEQMNWTIVYPPKELELE